MGDRFAGWIGWITNTECGEQQVVEFGGGLGDGGIEDCDDDLLVIGNGLGDEPCLGAEVAGVWGSGLRGGNLDVGLDGGYGWVV